MKNLKPENAHVNFETQKRIVEILVDTASEVFKIRSFQAKAIKDKLNSLIDQKQEEERAKLENSCSIVRLDLGTQLFEIGKDDLEEILIISEDIFCLKYSNCSVYINMKYGYEYVYKEDCKE